MAFEHCFQSSHPRHRLIMSAIRVMDVAQEKAMSNSRKPKIRFITDFTDKPS
jgi:hypothetical protein